MGFFKSLFGGGGSDDRAYRLQLQQMEQQERQFQDQLNAQRDYQDRVLNLQEQAAGERQAQEEMLDEQRRLENARESARKKASAMGRNTRRSLASGLGVDDDDVKLGAAA